MPKIPADVVKGFISEVLCQPMFITPEGFNRLKQMVMENGATRLIISEEEQETPVEHTMTYMGVSGDKSKSKPSTKYLSVIPVQGPLVARESDYSKWYGLMSYESIGNMFREALADPNSEAIMFDIDSPGGESTNLMDFVDEIYNARGQKPIYSIANNYAFSAAYAIASAADKHFITRDGMNGSVGVIMQHEDWSKALEDFGIKVTSIYAGKRKNDFSPYFPLSKEAKDKAQSIVDDHYETFTSTVARNRGIKQSAVKKTEADIFLANEAIDVGFADEVMNYENTVTRVFESTGNVEATGQFELEGSNKVSETDNKITLSEETELKTNEKEVKSMDLKELKEKHPELYQEVVDSVKTEYEGKITGLKSEMAGIKSDMEGIKEDNLRLKEENTIRSHNERKALASGIWKDCLAESDIPADMHGEIMQMVSHAKFTTDGVFDQAGFTEAVQSKIADWESKGVTSSVMGMSMTSKEDEVDTTQQEEVKAENKSISSRLLGLAGQPQKE